MNTILSLMLAIVGLFAHDSAIIIASGLFGIAGAIEYCVYKIKK